MAALSQNVPRPELAGAVALLRRFENGRLRKTALGAQDAPALAALHQVYGAVADTGDCWRQTYAPQWLRARELPLAAQVIDETPSTQTLLQNSAAPRVLFAEHQTAGLGRRGRGWLGLPADAIAVSLLLPAPAVVAGLSVALGAALAAALSDEVFFKWPNDLLDGNGQKIAGLLTQLRGGAVLLGAGLNWRVTPELRARVAAMGGAPAGALAALPNKAGSRAACAALCAQTLAATVADYAGFAAHQKRATAAHIVKMGAAMRVAGAPVTFAGFDTDGALLACPPGGAPARYVSAEVEHVARH